MQIFNCSWEILQLFWPPKYCFSKIQDFFFHSTWIELFRWLNYIYSFVSTVEGNSFKNLQQNTARIWKSFTYTDFPSEILPRISWLSNGNGLLSLSLFLTYFSFRKKRKTFGLGLTMTLESLQGRTEAKNLNLMK